MRVGVLSCDGEVQTLWGWEEGVRRRRRRSRKTKCVTGDVLVIFENINAQVNLLSLSLQMLNTTKNCAHVETL